MITQEILKKHFRYLDGYFIRIDSKRKSDPRNIKSEYQTTMFKGKLYKTHRLIFMYHHGYIPEQVDHIDGNKHNNKIENLRPATQSKNSMNIKLRSDNTSGSKNVYWEGDRKKWRVIVHKQGRSVYSKRFDDKELADLVAIMAREKYHKEFANHGNYLGV